MESIETVGRAMGFAYLGIGAGGALVPFLGVWLTSAFGWQNALRANVYPRDRDSMRAMQVVLAGSNSVAHRPLK